MNMKKLVLAVAMSSAMVMGAAHAASQGGHGTVTFRGEIIDSACSITPDTIDQTVQMGEISNKVLANGGSSTPRDFNIKLENCDISGLKDKTVTPTFTGTASTANPDLLAIAGTASGASIALTQDNSKPIKLGEPAQPFSIRDGNNTLHFAAYLKGDGASTAVVPGDFSAVANFTLEYK